MFEVRKVSKPSGFCGQLAINGIHVDRDFIELYINSGDRSLRDNYRTYCLCSDHRTRLHSLKFEKTEKRLASVGERWIIFFMVFCFIVLLLI